MSVLTNLVGSLLGAVRKNRLDPRGDLSAANVARIGQYGRFLRAYQGFAIRGDVPTGQPEAWKPLKYNFCRPIVNIGAGWFAGTPLVWEVKGEDGQPDETATGAAREVWDRSGAERTFLEAAIQCGIYGDCVILVTKGPDGLPALEFLDPSICFPVFDGHDFSNLVTLEICYHVTTGFESAYLRREIYEANEAQIFHGDELVDRFTYEYLPATWVRNQGIKGLMFGMSDLDGVVDLVEEYDHLAGKQTQIVDYHAAPTPVFIGVQRGDWSKDVRSVLYLPMGGDAKFLEWTGDHPDVENQLTRIRNAIAEVSEVPAIAFGQMDRGYTTISGIGLKILYGPLLDKVRRKQAAWGPRLEYAMWLALLAQNIRVPLEAVNAVWQDPTPVDPLQVIQEQTQAVSGGLKSRRTAMQAVGVEDPDAELKQIMAEREMFAPQMGRETEREDENGGDARPEGDR